jgi:hypothetical protein
MLLPLPVRAEAHECDLGWERFAGLARIESRSGLTLARLDEINQLIPLLEDCAGEELEGSWLSGVERWGPLVATYFQPEDVERTLCLMDFESSGDPEARNPISGASGLMQVMPFWADHFGYDTDALFDPQVNLEISAWIRDRHGWNAWSPYRRGSCR